MKLVYTALGFVSALRYEQNKNEWELTFDKNNSWSKTNKKAVYVMLARDTTEILLVRWQPKKTTVPPGADKQKKLVRTWSRWEYLNAWTLPTERKKMHPAGRITRIEYTSDKFDVSRDKRGTFNLYRHDFESVVPFYMSTNEDVFKFSFPLLLSGRGIIA